MKIQPNEADFSTWFKKNYAGWNERIEPTLGMSPGIPDRLVMTDIGIVPVELKIASLSDGRLWSREIRPAQVAWHMNFYQQNKGRLPLTVFLFGVWSADRWKVLATEGDSVRDWEDGFLLDEVTGLGAGNITESFEAYCAEKLG